MSNYEAGKLYEAVIDEVITDSRQDFEDSGIDESTLQELKRLWCEKLSQVKVCNFAWDEEESGLHVQHSILGPTSVRNEALHLSSELELPNIPYDSSLNAIHNSGIAETGESGYSMGIELPTIKQEFNDDNGLIIPKVHQSDGSFELTLEMETTKAKTSIEKLKSKLRSQADGPGDDDDDDDDDIFNDSDDINSDLDDELDSEKSDEDDADQEGRIMLCLYDKVQRVKNKWKCNLKEGIANIDGRDYIFQRATGESEW